MLLINLQNCYLRKVTEIGTAWLYAELSVGSLARGAEGGREGALHSFSLHRILFFQGGWLPGNSKYNWRNGFIWRESHERREGEHRAVTKLRMGWRNPHLFRWLLSKLHTIIYFRILSYPVSIPWKKRKMSVELAAPRALPAALLGWCLAPRSIAIALTCRSGTRALPGSGPTSRTPLLPTLLFPPPSPLPRSLSLKTVELTSHLLPALLTQHSFPMQLFHPDWNLLDAKPISFLVFGFFFSSGTIRRYSCLLPCIIAAINVNNNSMRKLSMINCFWGEIISSLGYTPPIRSL